jgi:uncharacterized membrane protein (DUF2068 family)
VQNTALQNRPLGITIIAVVLVVAGVIGIIAGIFTLVGSFFVFYHPIAGMRVGFIGVTSILLGAIDLFVAWGLWTLKRWAFLVTVIIAALDILQALWALFSGVNFWSALFSIILPAIVLIYMLADRNVRAAFHV